MMLGAKRILLGSLLAGILVLFWTMFVPGSDAGKLSQPTQSEDPNSGIEEQTRLGSPLLDFERREPLDPPPLPQGINDQAMTAILRVVDSSQAPIPDPMVSTIKDGEPDSPMWHGTSDGRLRIPLTEIPADRVLIASADGFAPLYLPAKLVQDSAEVPVVITLVRSGSALVALDDPQCLPDIHGRIILSYIGPGDEPSLLKLADLYGDRMVKLREIHLDGVPNGRVTGLFPGYWRVFSARHLEHLECKIEGEYHLIPQGREVLAVVPALHRDRTRFASGWLFPDLVDGKLLPGHFSSTPPIPATRFQLESSGRFAILFTEDTTYSVSYHTDDGRSVEFEMRNGDHDFYIMSSELVRGK